nr:hypothetical protein [Tanacetum cinerariifolium]
MSLTRIRLMLLSEAFHSESPFITSESTTQSGTSVVKDSLSMDEAIDLPCVELLNENRTLIRKYPKNLLCIMGLSRSFIDTDVKVGERALAENEVPLITETEDRVISPSLQTISLVDYTIQDKLNLNSGEQAATSSGSAAPVTEYVTSSFVTPTLECALEDALHDNAGVSVPVTKSTDNGRPLSAHKLETGNLARVDNPVICCSFIDHVTPPGYWVALRNQSDAGAAIVQQRDAEVFELKAKLEKSESEAVKVEELHKRVSNLEAMAAVKVGEAASLTTQNDGLLKKVFALELECDGLKGQVIGFGSYGKAGRFLVQIEAYDLEVKGKYVAVIFEFKGVSFPLLDELESLKDSVRN